jgi:hypothetical protein
MAKNKPSSAHAVSSPQAAGAKNMIGLSKSAKKRARKIAKAVIKAAEAKSEKLVRKGEQNASDFSNGLAVTVSTQASADAYAESLAFPELFLNAKVPDSSIKPTSLVHAQTEYVLPVCSDGAGTPTYYAGIFIPHTGLITATSPSAGQGIQILTAATSGTFTWSQTNGTTRPYFPSNAAQTQLAADFQSQRSVSIAGVLENLTAAQYADGEFATMRYVSQQETAALVELVDNWTDLSADVAVHKVSAAAGTKSVRNTTFPYTLGAAAGFANVANNTASDGIVLLWRGAYATSVISAKIYANIEMVPFSELQYLLPASMDVGSDQALMNGVRKFLQFFAGGLYTVEAVAEFLQSKQWASIQRGAKAMWSGAMGLLGLRSRHNRLLAVALTSARTEDLARFGLVRGPDDHVGAESIRSQAQRLWNSEVTSKLRYLDSDDDEKSSIMFVNRRM